MQLPDNGISFTPPITMFNLSGGNKCIAGGNGQCVLFSPSGAHFWTDLTGLKTPDLLNYMLPTRAITYSIFSNVEGLDDPLPETRLYMLNADGSPQSEVQAQRWSGLSVAYRKRNENENSIRAERISLQVRLCVDTLNLLLQSYHMALIEKYDTAHISDPENGNTHFTSDKFATNIGYRTQSCLNELFALRDFIFYFLLENMYGKKISIGSAIKLLEADDRFGLASLIIPAIQKENPVGLIAKMSLYRNVFFHFIGPKGGPLGQSYYFQQHHGPIGPLDSLVFPLHDDLDLLRKIEKGNGLALSQTEQAEAIRFMQLKSHTDALDLCYDSLSLLLKISEAIESKIEIVSEAVIIDNSQIIELIVTDNDGNRKKYIKDEEGKLVEAPLDENNDQPNE